MFLTSHPCRGRGRKKKKKKKKHKQRNSEDKPGSFDWDTVSSKSGHANGGKNSSNSTLIYFMVPDIVIRTPPGSGTGLIPLCLPRQEKMANQELTQLKSLQRGVFASRNSNMALSIDEIKISSEYRLLSNFPSFSKKN